MAKDKKSVLLYCDIIHTVDGLTDEEAGRLFKHYLMYINDLDPTPIDRLTGLLFEPIKQNLKRDLAKWNERSKRNSDIAKEGWKKRKDANACERIETDAKNADKDIVIVKDKDTVKDISKEQLEERKMGFKKSLIKVGDKYSVGLLKEFFLYWTEHNEGGRKMRFEYAKNQPFNISRRLSTWNKNNKTSVKPSGAASSSILEMINKQ